MKRKISTSLLVSLFAVSAIGAGQMASANMLDTTCIKVQLAENNSDLHKKGKPPAPPTDENGNPLPPPDGKHGQKPPAPPTDKDGNPLPPPTDENGNPLPPPDKKA